MKIPKIIFALGGFVVLFSAAALSISQWHAVDAESDNLNEAVAFAEPTAAPASASAFGVGIQKKDAPEMLSPQTKIQLAEKFLAQYDWEGREDEKSMFHLTLLCTNTWLNGDEWKIQKESELESAFSMEMKEQFIEEILAQYSWDNRENEKEMFCEVLLRIDDLGSVYVYNPNNKE